MMPTNKYIILVSLVCPLVIGAPQEDLVTNLPGIDPQPSFKHYSGYLQATGQKRLHYWFVESQRNASADPILLWMNGGPGCSSLGGLLKLHGPFRQQDDGKTLEYHPHSWNKVSSVIYLEAPAGVGYSYAADDNITTSDDDTAENNYVALVDFFRKFPEYKSNDFYITGESYAGIYVPTLAVRVSQDSSINLKGAAIGNGCVDFVVLPNHMYHYYYSRNVYDSTLWRPVLNNCCTDQNVNDCQFVPSRTEDCSLALADADLAIARANLNPYNINAHCIDSPVGKQMSFEEKLNLLPLTIRDKIESYSHRPDIQLKLWETYAIPCVNSTSHTTYLNRQDVRTALHIPPSLPAWQACSSEVSAEYERQYASMRDHFLQLLSGGQYRLMVYQGDLDLACNFMGITAFIENLTQPLEDGHKPWEYQAADGSYQVAGFVTQYTNLINLNIKGAGHFVPADYPIAALDMINKFITNDPF